MPYSVKLLSKFDLLMSSFFNMENLLQTLLYLGTQGHDMSMSQIFPPSPLQSFFILSCHELSFSWKEVDLNHSPTYQLYLIL